MKTRITLTQEEINTAILAYVQEEGIVLEGMDVDVALTAARSPQGYSATVDIQKAGTKKKAPRRVNKVTAPAKAPVIEPVSEIQETEDTATDSGSETPEEADQANADLEEELQSTDEEDAADDAEADPQVSDQPEVKKVGAASVSIFDTDDEPAASEAKAEPAAATSSSSLFD